MENLILCFLAYNKSISLLHEQTKFVLSQPFYTAEECDKLNWIDKENKVEDDDMWDNEDIRIILRKDYT